MNASQEHQIRHDAEIEADPRIDLAVERTELALERTHLAWVRTIIGLIGGGFAIDRGVETFRNARIDSGNAWINHGQMAGLILTSSGTILMAMVTIYYIGRMKAFRQMRGIKGVFFPPGLILSILIFFIGALLIYIMGFASK